MIISYSCSDILNIANIHNNNIRGYKSDKLSVASECITNVCDVEYEKKRKVRISNPVYLKYAELCNNEEWKNFFMRLVSNKIKKSTTQTYNNQYFKSGRASKNSSNVFVHPEEIDLVALISFQKFLRSRNVFMSEEDREIIHIEATTSSSNSKIKKIDKKRVLDRYFNSSCFINDCKSIGITNIALAADQMRTLVDAGIVKQGEFVYNDKYEIIEIKNFDDYMKAYCQKCFL